MEGLKSRGRRSDPAPQVETMGGVNWSLMATELHFSQDILRTLKESECNFARNRAELQRRGWTILFYPEWWS